MKRRNLYALILTAVLTANVMFTGCSAVSESEKSSNLQSDISVSTKTGETENVSTEEKTEETESMETEKLVIRNYNYREAEDDTCVRVTMGIDCHYDLPSEFTYDNKGSYILDSYYLPLEERKKGGVRIFWGIPQICDEYNGLSVDINAPDTWLDTTQAELIRFMSMSNTKYELFHLKTEQHSPSEITIDSQEQVNIDGRTWIKFTAHTIEYDGETRIDMLGYITVVQGDDLSNYKTANIIGFMVSDYTEYADFELFDSYTKHSAESLALGYMLE